MYYSPPPGVASSALLISEPLTIYLSDSLKDVLFNTQCIEPAICICTLLRFPSVQVQLEKEAELNALDRELNNVQQELERKASEVEELRVRYHKGCQEVEAAEEKTRREHLEVRIECTLQFGCCVPELDEYVEKISDSSTRT